MGSVAQHESAFGGNYLSVVAAEGRFVLSNGTHRAYALRALGITHVPCVIQQVSRRDELDVVLSQISGPNADHYLRHRRPPLLKDYFDDRLRRIVHLAPTARHVRVTLTVETVDLPILFAPTLLNTNVASQAA